MKPRLPWVTAAVASFCVLATCVPFIGHWLVYDRAAIMDGEIWRVVTGHLVHFSALHLGCNLLMFIVISASLERVHGRSILGLCTTMAVAIGVGLFVVHPQMSRYGGLSGLVCGLFVSDALNRSRLGGISGWCGRLILVVIALKILFECIGIRCFSIDWRGQGFVVMPLSHALGGLTATAWWLIGKKMRAWTRSNPLYGRKWARGNISTAANPIFREAKPCTGKGVWP